jgi:hypothetical protein
MILAYRVLGVRVSSKSTVLLLGQCCLGAYDWIVGLTVPFVWFACRFRRSRRHPIHVPGSPEGGHRAGELRAAVLAYGGRQDLPTCLWRAESELRER